MRAAVFRGRHQMEIKELPKPEIGTGEALLRVIGCGVCGTDVHIYDGDIRDAVPPVVIGHEIMGRIESLASEVTGLEVGDTVIVDPFVYCGHCDFCKQGEYRFCLNETFIGYRRTGGFSQYTAVPQANLYRIPAETDLRQGILVETLATVIAGLSRLQPESGRSCLILGAGTVGLLWNQVLRNNLLLNLIQTEVIPERLTRAEKLGADRALSPKEESLEKAVYDLCPHGVDYIIDATGSTEAISEALPLIKRGGTFLSFGICPEDERLSLSLNWLYKQQIKIITSRRPPREMQRAVEIMKKGLIDSALIVTGIFPLTRIEETFRMFHENKDQQIKMAIDPWL